RRRGEVAQDDAPGPPTTPAPHPGVAASTRRRHQPGPPRLLQRRGLRPGTARRREARRGRPGRPAPALSRGLNACPGSTRLLVRAAPPVPLWPAEGQGQTGAEEYGCASRGEGSRALVEGPGPPGGPAAAPPAQRHHGEGQDGG